MKYCIFISSVQREFATERKLLADYIRKDVRVSLLHRRHRSIPVNPLLARGMFYRGYIEKVGSGTGDMLEKCRAAGTPAPQWIEEDDGFTVVLKKRDFANAASEVTINGVLKSGLETTEKTTEKITERTSVRIINALKINPVASMRELAKICDITEDGVFYQLKQLKRKNQIRRVGPDKGGHWEVLVPPT